VGGVAAKANAAARAKAESPMRIKQGSSEMYFVFSVLWFFSLDLDNLPHSNRSYPRSNPRRKREQPHLTLSLSLSLSKILPVLSPTGYLLEPESLKKHTHVHGRP